MEVAYKLKSYSSLNDYILLKKDNNDKIKIFNIDYDVKKVLNYLEMELPKDLYTEVETNIKLKKDIYIVTNKYETRHLIRKLS
jgi:hypothetical protein